MHANDRNVPVKTAKDAKALIYHYRLIRVAGAMDAMEAQQIPQTIVRSLSRTVN